MNRNEARSVENLVLAITRTDLANRRTLLSYLKTAIGLFVSGAALLRLSDDSRLELMGLVFMPLSLVVVVIGIVDYRIQRRNIMAEKAIAEADKADLS